MILALLDYTVGTVWQCDLELIKGWSSDVPKEFYENLIIEKGFNLDNIAYMVYESSLGDISYF
tara:strand:- start:210 stop:398 length:189 start_codon:yes stop_codon:yes gene_type:complete